MIPVIAPVSVSAPAPASLVATSLPDSFAVRVPYTDVPPSVSSVQINNNARGNGSYVAVENVAQYPVPVVEGESVTGVAGSVTSSRIPAAFLAQMIGQNVPASMQAALSNVLASYDQLVANSFVKYRPSNATLPPPPPANVFGRILAQESVASLPVTETTVPVTPPPAPRIQDDAMPQYAQMAAPEMRPAPTPPEKPASGRAQETASRKQTATSPVRAAIAYLMSEARIDFEAPPAIRASI